jgi:pimeloyl-ACP methyl ester carboxylesterase
VPQKYFRIDGTAVYVHHTGPTTLPEEVPDLSRGELVLCLHGAKGNGNVFRATLDRLAAEHSPLAFDQPGHARSGGLDSLGSIERMAEFTHTLCERLGLRIPVLLGHSMGGAVALAYALERPDRVRALVLCSAGARFELPEELIEFSRRVTEGKERHRVAREAYSAATPPEVFRQGVMEDLKTDPRVGYGDLLACRAWSAGDRLREVGVPALVVVGEDEMPPLRGEADRLVEELPRARQVVIPKAGHMVPLEQPEAFAAAVGAFLGELSA